MRIRRAHGSRLELAAEYMGASAANVSASSSSVRKGETLIDTARTIDAMERTLLFCAIR